ncbi:energy transducer TonB [Lutimonas sp.]|uniref:energy transducer TonB n=1 Tax=Lutimonas sp. TaxID=1872403 RepID=UPI003D9BC4E7
MKNSKYNISKRKLMQLDSRLCLQLGIIFALIVVYIGFESTFAKDLIVISENRLVDNEPDMYAVPPFEIEQKKAIEEKPRVKTPVLINDFVIDEPDKVIEEVLAPEPPSDPVDFDEVFSDVPEIAEPDDESYIFVAVEQAPRFPGCVEDSEEAYRACFNEKVKKLVSKKFNTNLDLGLRGKQRIIVFFEIDKEGNIINVVARAPHKRLEKEAMKAVGKLPQMIPAKQRQRNVSVKYSLPISFYLQ